MRSLGHATQNYVVALEQTWGLNLGTDTVFNSLYCECRALLCNPKKIATERFVGRIWFADTADKDADVSVFLIVDLTSSKAWFSEKDRSYRVSVCEWLRGIKSEFST